MKNKLALRTQKHLTQAIQAAVTDMIRRGTNPSEANVFANNVLLAVAAGSFVSLSGRPMEECQELYERLLHTVEEWAGEKNVAA